MDAKQRLGEDKINIDNRLALSSYVSLFRIAEANERTQNYVRITHAQQQIHQFRIHAMNLIFGRA